MVVSRVIIRVTPFRALITLLITYLLSPLPLQVKARAFGFQDSGLQSLMLLCGLVDSAGIVGRDPPPASKRGVGLGFRA